MKRPAQIQQILADIRAALPREQLRALTNYIGDLERMVPPVLPSGKYKPKLAYSQPPDKIAEVQWTQPRQRLAPAWDFEITCPYCGMTKTITRLSATEPSHCDEESCNREHIRLLARERKRRERERKKTGSSHAPLRQRD